MTATLIALIALIGFGGTAIAADHALPGDALYPLDRTLEQVRLMTALSPQQRATLEAYYTTKRLNELHAIIARSVTISPSTINLATVASSTAGAGNGSTAAVATVGALAIRAHVFTDTTIVTVSLDGDTVYLQTSATTTPGIIAAITRAFPTVTLNEITLALSVQPEQRVSTLQDTGIPQVTPEGEAAIATGVRAVLDFARQTDVSTTQRQAFTQKLASEVNGLTPRISVDVAHGLVHLDQDILPIDPAYATTTTAATPVALPVDQAAGRSDQGTSSASVTAMSATSTSNSELSIEARVYTDGTMVTIGYAGQHLSFTTSATEKSAIAQVITQHFPSLSLPAINAVMVVVSEGRLQIPAVSPVRDPSTMTTHRETPQWEQRQEESEEHE